jgi:RNA polymerase sigma-70 factor (ECF subfamily)
LIARIGRGDQLAMSQLYDRYAPTVLGLLARVVGDRSVAEDLLQETFWRVWRSAGSYEPGKGSVAGWLYTIARHAGLDARRRSGARPVAADLLPPEEDRAVEPDPEVDVAGDAWREVRHAQVRSALDALPEDQRSVVTMAYFSGLTRREIAEATGLPLGTVHTRARLAMDKLRLTLDGDRFAEVAS